MNNSEKEILDRISDGFIALDENWNFTYVNKEAAKILNRKKEEFKGRSIWKVLPYAADLGMYKEFQKSFKEQVTVTFDMYYPL